MKKLISLLLVLVFLFSIPCTQVSAAGTFNKSVFEKSTKYTYNASTREWNLQDCYKKVFTNAVVYVYSLLFSDYVDEGWGPELRIYYYDKQTGNYDQVVAFRALINDVLYCFEDLGEGSGGGGYVFGGTVQEAFMRALLSAKTVTFQFDHVTRSGAVYTGTIDHVHTGELSSLVEMAGYLIKSNAFFVCDDPKGMDEAFGAYMYKS